MSRRLPKFLLGFLVPHSLVVLRSELKRKRAMRLARAARVEEQSGDGKLTFDYEQAVAFLAAQRCDERQVIEGSMPPTSLEFCGRAISRLYAGEPLMGLHVGNFVGLSLCYFTSLVRSLHPDSRVIAIDPNVPHRGISDPAGEVIRMLCHFQCQANSLLLTGYTLEKSISNDGLDSTGAYDPVAAFAGEMSCEQQLPALKFLCSCRFDFCVIDGNHSGEYLEREIAVVEDLLKPNGLLILDDITESWHEIRSVFEGRVGRGFSRVGTDGQVGILKKEPSAETNGSTSKGQPGVTRPQSPR